jgi:uncharacterized protein (DUF433 family)
MVHLVDWREHIHSDASILLGKPTIKGTRISVELLLELLGKGWSIQDILASYPHLTNEDLQAVFMYLRDCIREELYFPIQAQA